MMDFADTFALWVGRIVIGLSTGIFVGGAALMVADYFGREMFSKLTSLYNMSVLEKAAREVLARKEAK